MEEKAKGKQNNDLKLLLEPFEGFHPSRLAQTLMAGRIWDKLVAEFGIDVVAPENPQNARIESLFGDQGGH